MICCAFQLARNLLFLSLSCCQEDEDSEANKKQVPDLQEKLKSKDKEVCMIPSVTNSYYFAVDMHCT